MVGLLCVEHTIHVSYGARSGLISYCTSSQLHCYIPEISCVRVYRAYGKYY